MDDINPTYIAAMLKKIADNCINYNAHEIRVIEIGFDSASHARSAVDTTLHYINNGYKLAWMTLSSWKLSHYEKGKSSVDVLVMVKSDTISNGFILSDLVDVVENSAHLKSICVEVAREIRAVGAITSAHG